MDEKAGTPEEPEEEEEDEIVESDIELEGDTVEPDNDPPQKVPFRSYCVSVLLCFFNVLSSVSMALAVCRWEMHL